MCQNYKCHSETKIEDALVGTINPKQAPERRLKNRDHAMGFPKLL